MTFRARQMNTLAISIEYVWKQEVYIFILYYFQKPKSFTDVTIGHLLGDSKSTSHVFSRLSTENDFLLSYLIHVYVWELYKLYFEISTKNLKF